ncbi:MAG: ATP-binding protein [Prochloraceae cyanobacterium]
MESSELVASRGEILGCGIYEPIHIPGQIQPHGVIFVLQQEKEKLKILQVSENTNRWLGIPPKELIGKNLSCLLVKSQIEKIVNEPREEEKEYDKITLKLKQPKKLSLVFSGKSYRDRELIFLELEPQEKKKKDSGLELLSELNNSLKKIKKETKLSGLCARFLGEIEKITGYDRLMVYRFKADNSGVVIAEKRKTDEIESYLGLHYPASDVDKKSREYYIKNSLRMIPDINYKPVNLIPQKNSITGATIDLYQSIFRSVAPCHLDYLKNMGVTATMVISLIEEEKLWGLVVCHNYEPKYLDRQTRKFCQILGQYMSAEIFRQQTEESISYRNKVRSIQERIRHNLAKESNKIGDVLSGNKSSLLDLVRASGAAIVLGEQINPIGETPEISEIENLINWLQQNKRQECFQTEYLEAYYPAAKKFKDKASGILAISIYIKPTSYHLIWFRAEQTQTVNWAGNPQDSFSIDENGQIQLSPRSSFESWKEQVKNKSLPWQNSEIEAAKELRTSLSLAALEFSQTALKKAAQKAQVANFAKSQFLAKMSHELRTPLNAILGFTQIMNRFNDLSASQKEHVEIINRSGEHLLGLINDVLDMAKIEAGQLYLKDKCFDLHRLVRSIEEMLKLKASQKGLELIVEKDEEIPQYVCGDESKLRQIIINLVSNAIKFTNVGSVQLKVFCPVPTKKGMSDRIDIRFEVKDTGPGIRLEDREKIFEPFQQTDIGREEKDGTGLGLPISRQFARLMEGDIKVDSEFGKGTNFTCYVKLKIAEEICLLPDGNGKRVIGIELEQPKYRILIVEDVPENQQLMVKLLKSVGFEVKAANNGLEAIEMFHKWRPNFIWMDMRMPVMNGYEATKKIKATKLGKKTTIVALTASVLNPEPLLVKEAGCDDFLSKPFKENEIFEKMAVYLGVRYVYEEKSQRKARFNDIPLTALTTTPSLEAELRPLIEQMPKQWRENIYKAAVGVRETRIRESIAAIPEDFSPLTKTLTEMVDLLDFDSIVNLVEPLI